MTVYHRLQKVAAALVGTTLFVSGSFKLMDPVGTGLIVDEYWKLFHLGFMAPASQVFGLLLSLTEALLGVALTTGLFRKTVRIAAASLVGFFTLITAVLAILNPVMDCGCFGEAIHLTHGETLLKNLVLVALALIAFIPFQNFGVPRKGKYAAFALAVLSLIYALWYNARHLPMIDFTEFSPGTELFASLDNDYQALDDKVPTFIYERNGQRGSFTLDALPDSTWTFVAVDTLTRSGMYKNASKPVLSFRDEAGTYQDELAVLGKVIVFSVYDPAKVDWTLLRAQAADAQDAGATALILTVPAENVPQGVYYADFKPLITLNRANGGATYFEEGEVISKWSPRDYPEKERLQDLLDREPVSVSTDFIVPRRIKAQGFTVYLLALLLLL